MIPALDLISLGTRVKLHQPTLSYRAEWIRSTGERNHTPLLGLTVITRVASGSSRGYVEGVTEAEQQAKQWYKRKLKTRVQAANYRAKRAGLLADLCVEEYMAWEDAWGHQCAYCGRPRGFLIEHMTPISRGGPSTLSNVVPACAWCNNLKKNRTVEEWLDEGDLSDFLARRERIQVLYELGVGRH